MQWYTIEESEASGEYGTRPENRSVEELLEQGIFIVDKPFGPTSNQVSGWIKEELGLRKTGHFGTLDPNATGVLPIGINKGTRIQEALSEARKEYVFEAKLEDERKEREVREKLQEFQGINSQVPPEKSAVKREEREREVYEIELLEVSGKKILGRVKCESGFYVRVLVEQLGDRLETEAEMSELRRTMQGDITESGTSTLQDIVDAYHFYRESGEEDGIRKVLMPIEHAVSHLSKIVIKDSAVNAVANGSNLGVSGISKLQDFEEEDRVAIMTLKGELVALARSEMSSEEIYDGEGTAADLESVHMDPEKYPKRWKQ